MMAPWNPRVRRLLIQEARAFPADKGNEYPVLVFALAVRKGLLQEE